MHKFNFYGYELYGNSFDKNQDFFEEIDDMLSTGIMSITDQGGTPFIGIITTEDGLTDKIEEKINSLEIPEDLNPDLPSFRIVYPNYETFEFLREDLKGFTISEESLTVMKTDETFREFCEEILGE